MNSYFIGVAMFGLGHTEIILIVVAIVILFGATKIPALGSSIGQGIRNHRKLYHIS